MVCRVTRKMNRILFCFLVLGIANISSGADVNFDNVGAETKEVSSKTTGNVSGNNFFDKNKRGAAKITNIDNPGFNHLTSSNVASSSSSSSGFKPVSAPVSNPPPFKYLYSNQYYQPSPYLTYVQIPQAAQIAAQYAFQPNPVAHYLQTPTQIQYVSTPTVAQVQQPVKYQTFSNEYASVPAEGANFGVSSAPQYVAPSQIQSSSHYSGSSAQALASSASASQNKQVQVPLYSNYQTAQPVYHQQQPFYTFVMQPQTSAANFIYQQPNANYLFKQQQLLNFYGGNRFGFYTPAQNNQITYMVPIAVHQSGQEQTTTSDSKTSDKSLTTAQTSQTANSFAYGTKA